MESTTSDIEASKLTYVYLTRLYVQAMGQAGAAPGNWKFGTVHLYDYINVTLFLI